MSSELFGILPKQTPCKTFFCILYIILYKYNTPWKHDWVNVLYKRTRCSLRSFTFFIKEHKRTLHSFWFHKSYKNDKSRKKKNKKERSVIFIRLKKNLTFFF